MLQHVGNMHVVKTTQKKRQVNVIQTLELWLALGSISI